MAHAREQIEVFDSDSEDTQIVFEGQSCEVRQIKKERIRALRLLREGRLGFAATWYAENDFKALDTLVEHARLSADQGEESTISFPELDQPEGTATDEPEGPDYSVEELHALGEEIARAVDSFGSGLKTRVHLNQWKGGQTIRHGDSKALSSRRSWLNASISIQRFREGDILGMSESIFTTGPKLQSKIALERLHEFLQLADETADLVPGRYPVLFTPKGSTALMVPVLPALNGRRIASGTSPLCGKMNKLEYDEKFNLIDDPSLPDRHYSVSHDDEGAPRTRRNIIKDGVVNSFFHDLTTAALLDTEPTGHGFREYPNEPPSPGYGNPTVRPGDLPLKEMLAKIDRGLLVHHVIGIGMNASAAGDFSYPIQLAFKIEGGEIKGRVKNLSITGNAHKLLRDIRSMSRETTVNSWNQELPHILLPHVDVIG